MHTEDCKRRGIPNVYAGKRGSEFVPVKIFNKLGGGLWGRGRLAYFVHGNFCFGLPLYLINNPSLIQYLPSY